MVLCAQSKSTEFIFFSPSKKGLFYSDIKTTSGQF